MKRTFLLILILAMVSCLVMAGTVEAKKDVIDKEGHEEKAAEGLLPMEKMAKSEAVITSDVKVLARPNQTSPPFPVTVTSLTAGPGDVEHPSWSPDSKTIVFQLEDSVDYDWEIYKINVDGTGLTRLTDNDACDSHPIYTPDGTKIIFVRNFDESGNDHAEIWRMNPDGSNQEEISPTGDEICRGKHISLSPDGTKVLYRYDDNYLYEYDILTDTETELVDGCWPPEYPKYSPDGAKILYRDDDYYIHVMNADGTDDLQLEDSYVKYFDWSPDGSKIVYTHNDESPFGLSLINPDGTGFEYLLETDEYCAGFPDWSPQGNWIAFAYGPQDEDGVDTDIRIMSLGGSAYSLTDWFDRCGVFSNPTFSPDGTKIVFVRGGSSEIVLIDGIPISKVPALMPIGIIALGGLLSIIGAISILRKRKG